MDNNKVFIMMIVFFAFFAVTILFFKPKKAEKYIPEKEVLEKIKDDDEAFNFNSGEYELIETEQVTNDDLIFENQNIKVEFTPNDALIKHAWIKDTFLSERKNNSYDIVQGNKNSGALRLKLGSWENEKTLRNLTNGNNLYNFKRVGDSFIFSCKFKKKNDSLIYTIVKRFTFLDDENIFKLDVELFNNKNKAINFDSTDIAYSLGWGPLLGIDSRKAHVDKRLRNIFTYLNEKKIVKINGKGKLFKKDSAVKGFATKYREGNESWIASNGHYFASIIYPDNQNYKYFFDYRDKENKNFYCGLSRNTNNSNLKSTYYVYIGPKINSVLKKYDNFQREKFNLSNSNISRIDEKIIFGIGNVIGHILNFIYKYVKNYGVAIILLTLLIKVVLFPLTYKSMQSQQNMNKLQPKIKELQEKYKDKPDVLNKETMSMYKREGINPLGGCLPLLFQMPILIAMYNLLSRMVALKGASFLWVKDLSKPDSVLDFAFTVPFVNINSLNLLPFLMVGLQIISSLFMPNTQSNQQAKMMIWLMPLFFFFIFYNVASGLVLYWTIMNLLNLIQQVYMNKIGDTPKKPPQRA